MLHCRAGGDGELGCLCGKAGTSHLCNIHLGAWSMLWLPASASIIMNFKSRQLLNPVLTHRKPLHRGENLSSLNMSVVLNIHYCMECDITGWYGRYIIHTTGSADKRPSLVCEKTGMSL